MQSDERSEHLVENKNRTAGGVNSIPLTCPKEENYQVIEDVKLDKRILFDWISFTFDDLDIEAVLSRSSYGIKKKIGYKIHLDILNNLLVALGSEKYHYDLEIKQPGLNNYKYILYIGEHIIINFHGPKSYRGKYTTQLLMRGERCREFIEYQNGNWIELFKVLGTLNGSFKRVDIAIDDFTANDIDIYDLQKYAEAGHWTGSFQSLKIINDISFRGGIRSKGYSLTFGSPGSNQLQIYDKNLERFSKKKESFDTKVWYRYEMRLVNKRANNAIREYMRAFAYDSSNISSFLEFGSSLLAELIMFKKEPRGNDTRVRRWEPLDKWTSFLGSIKKINFIPNTKLEKTIDLKKKWYKKSISSTNAEFFLSNENGYFDFQLEIVKNGIKKMNKRKLSTVNKKRLSMGKAALTMEEINEMLSFEPPYSVN
jgi:hypothetical protein